MEFGGLTDVETRDVSGLEDKCVCSFKLVVDVVVLDSSIGKSISKES